MGPHWHKSPWVGASISHTRPYESTFARIFLFLERHEFLGSAHTVLKGLTKTNKAVKLNLNRANWCKLMWMRVSCSRVCSNNRKIRAKVDSKIYCIWRLLVMGSWPTQEQRKTLSRKGIEPTTFGLNHHCSTDWATRSDGSKSWELKMLKSRQWTCSTSTRKDYVIQYNTYLNDRSP